MIAQSHNAFTALLKKHLNNDRVDDYPLKRIEDIGNVLKGPWKRHVVRLFGRIQTLDHVEQ